MRYYVYLSEAKLRSLHPQIGGRKSGRRTTSVKLTTPIGQVGHERVAESPDAEVHRMLGDLEDWIVLNESVGTVDEPEAWIYGQLSLGGTSFGWNHDPSPDGHVMFGGLTKDSGIVLGGSAIHLVGRTTLPGGHPDGVTPHYSSAVFLQRALNAISPVNFEDEQETPSTVGWSRLTDRAHAQLVAAAFELGGEGGRGATFCPAPVGHCEFLAKRIYSVEDELGGAFTLATPLYIAMLSSRGPSSTNSGSRADPRRTPISEVIRPNGSRWD